MPLNTMAPRGRSTIEIATSGEMRTPPCIRQSCARMVWAVPMIIGTQGCYSQEARPGKR